MILRTVSHSGHLHIDEQHRSLIHSYDSLTHHREVHISRLNGGEDERHEMKMLAETSANADQVPQASIGGEVCSSPLYVD
jgi:hypothetical protein